jgi:hypothetical protein
VAVSVDSGPLDPTCLISYVAPKDWPRLVRIRKDHISVKLTYDCRCVAQFIKEANDLWESCGYKSADDLILNGYGLDPEEIRIVARWLELNDPQEAVSLEDVRATLSTHGGDRRSESFKQTDQVDSINLIHKGGTDPVYLEARLERDRPELKAAVDAGTVTVRQAAIQAGIVKPRVSVPREPGSAARALSRHFQGEQLRQLIESLQTYL